MFSRLTVWLLFAAALTAPLRAAERNAWPLWVVQEDEKTGQTTSVQSLGPLITQRTDANGDTQVWRPIFLRQQKGATETGHLLYPLISWQNDGTDRCFTIFQLINFRSSSGGAPGDTTTKAFDVWPFYFSRETGDPETSYRALLPFVGTIKYRFGKDRLMWRAFPLYLETVASNGRRTRHTPWPFIRTIDGNGHHGFEFWPLAGSSAREGDYTSQFALWPLIYRQEKHHEDETQPRVSVGVLPFYTRATADHFIDENYLWPFFGYTDRTAPQRYHETRYFWPFFVQGQGDVREVNRWAPFYTQSTVKGYRKTWVLWPLYRRGEWQEQNVAQQRDQVLFFLYWSNTQRSLTNPAAAPAYKRHFWPLVSVWDNGAGRRQLQALSPLEVFFPSNDPIRQLYSPLFALYRYDQRAPGDVRWSLLWNAVSRTSSPERSEFHLGPLFASRRTPTDSRITIGAGLLSWKRGSEQDKWRFSLFDFRRDRKVPAPATNIP